MKTLAAVLVEFNKPLELAELTIPKLKPGQCLVKVLYTGVCRTQLNEWKGHKGPDPYIPHCLGHEASGIVVEKGQGVKKVKSGQHVVMCWIKGKGAEVGKTLYKWGKNTVNAGAITTFGEYMVIGENRLNPLPKDIPMDQAAILGCAVPTGSGAVLNAARPKPKQSIAVFGVGGIGLCAVAGAAVSKCHPVIAVDVRENQLALARKMGATHTIQSGNGKNPVDEILKLYPGGLDYAVEATGKPEVMQQAILSVRNLGGNAVIIGNARQGDTWTLDTRQLNLGKRILGTWGGDSFPDRDFPLFYKFMRAGKLPLSIMIEKRYALEDINKAFNDMDSGKVARPLIEIAKE